MIQNTAERVIGFKRFSMDPWISDEVLDLADERRAVKMKKNNNLGDEKLKQSYIEHCCGTEKASSRNNMRKLFQKVETLRKTAQTSLKWANITNKNGKLLTDGTDMLKRRHDYGMSQFNANIPTNDYVLDQLRPNCKMDEQKPCILEKKVRAAFAKIVAHKAPCIDGIVD
jgi:hypothetical protein